MDVNIDSLIQDGKDIRKELTYVSPSAGEWRMYDEYAIKNPSKYYSWVATCFRFLVANYPNESIGKLFQDAAAAFEHKNNHFCPNPLEKMIGILESCKTLSTSLPQKENPFMSLNEEILNIEKSYSIYESFTHSKYNSDECISAYHTWYSGAAVLFSKFFQSSDDEYKIFRNVDNSGNGMVLHDNYKAIQASYCILLSRIKSGDIEKIDIAHKKDSTKPHVRKAPLLFISHSSEDEVLVEALVSMLQKIGFNKTNLFCSTIEGYGIDEGADIYETLRNKFTESKIYVVFILSKNYYASSACLNEMGAAWVLQSEYSTIVVPGFEIPDIKGAINPRKMAIVLNDKKHIRSSLNKFRERLLDLFSLPSLDDDIVWENNRNSFIEAVQQKDKLTE